jgi:predicted component of viral defense system (DUF524 family)
MDDDQMDENLTFFFSSLFNRWDDNQSSLLRYRFGSKRCQAKTNGLVSFQRVSMCKDFEIFDVAQVSQVSRF